MKINTFVLTVATVATVAHAQPHAHGHRHAHEALKQRDVTVTEMVPGPTAYVYQLDGQDLSIDQVCSGIENNQYTWANGDGPVDLCSSTSSTSSTTATTTTSVVSSSSTTTIPSASASSAPGEFFQRPSTFQFTSFGGVPTFSPPIPTYTTSQAPAAATSAVPSGATGIDAAFPDGQLSCSTFPSAYGAVYIDYLGMAGWTGLQALTLSGGAVTNIVTGISGDSCTEGMTCSYACPPGYQKTQWPSYQGATGQSVGGLLCSGGMLHLTNPSLSTSLCMAGVGGVQATNNAGSVISICRTDYPGTESETIPTVLEAGATQPLTCPDASSYYMWEGKSTSAQYYLNPPGYGASDACQWGSPGKPLGNYAPINFGVGAKDGVTWLSIMSNTPTTTATFPGTVEITGNISGSCKYENGQYCSAAGCNSAGCTVSLISGTATYVIS